LTDVAEHDGQAEAPEAPETLKELQARSDKLGAQLISLNDQAAKLAGQVEDVDKARIEALAGGGDSARFARQRADLEAEHARIVQDASVVGGWLAEADGEIARREAAIEGTRNLAAARKLLAERTDGQQDVHGRSGDRQRAAIAAVEAAAVDYVQVLADEAEADRLVTEAHAEVAALCERLGEPVPPMPVPPPSTQLQVPAAEAGPAGALWLAMQAARAGNTRLVAAKLAAAFGWTPPPPPTAEEVAARQQEFAAMLERNRQIWAGVKPLDPQLQRDASVDVDENGRPVYRPRRPPLPPHPRDSYLAPMLTGYGMQ
jgi:hypothetical protein